MKWLNFHILLNIWGTEIKLFNLIGSRHSNLCTTIQSKHSIPKAINNQAIHEQLGLG